MTWALYIFFLTLFIISWAATPSAIFFSNLYVGFWAFLVVFMALYVIFWALYVVVWAFYIVF